MQSDENNDTGASPAIEAATSQVSEAVGLLFERTGLKATVGRAWATLFLSPEPLETGTLKDRLDVSAGSLSAILKRLIELGFVYRETVPGRRTFAYRAETDLWLAVTRLYKSRARDRLADIQSLLEGAASALEEAEDRPAEVDYRIEQIRHLLGVMEFSIGILDAIMQRTRMELKAARKWLAVSGRLGGEPLSRLRRAINSRSS